MPLNNFAALQLNDVWGYIVIVAAIIGAAIYLIGTSKKGRSDIIRQDNDDLRKSNDEMRREKAANDATLKEQQESIRYLKDVATQTPAVTKLIEMNTRQQKLTNDQHVQVINALSELTGKISDLAGKFGTLADAINEQNKRSNP